MKEFGFKGKNASLESIGLGKVDAAYWNLSPAELVEETIVRGEGVLASNGALAVDTGEFTGRSPKDKFMVYDDITKDTIWWGDINIKFDAAKFDALYNRVTSYLEGKEVFVRDSYACADPKYRLNIRVVTETPWSNLFANNLFLRLTKDEIENFNPEWTIICAPGFKADPKIDGTRQHNFT